MLEGNLEARIWSIIRAMTSHLSLRELVIAVVGTVRGQTLEFAYGQREIPRDTVRLISQKFVSQSSIVPKSAFAFTVEP